MSNSHAAVGTVSGNALEQQFASVELLLLLGTSLLLEDSLLLGATLLSLGTELLSLGLELLLTDDAEEAEESLEDE